MPHRIMHTLFIFGDSTAAAKDEKSRPETGWGECFSPYLNKDWALDNRAINGRSTKLVLSNGEFFNALKDVKEGDAAIIQYGHNESKPDIERHTEPWRSFKDNLIFMATSLKKKGALVYFLTPIARRHFQEGKLLDTHGDYPKAMRETAREINIPLVDMTIITMDFLRSVGDDESKKIFMNFPSGLYDNYPEGKIDDTHLRTEGAKEIAYLTYKALLNYDPPFLIRS